MSPAKPAWDLTGGQVPGESRHRPGLGGPGGSDAAGPRDARWTRVAEHEEPCGARLGIVARRDLVKVLAREDAEIRAELVGLLEEQRAVIPPFQVAVRDGVVTLTGPAEQDLRDLAKLLARTIPGVIAVQFTDAAPGPMRQLRSAQPA